MCENIYDDVLYADDSQCGDQMEMAVNIVPNVAALRGHYDNAGRENGVTARTLHNQPSGSETSITKFTGPNLKANKYHRLIAVCVLLLLVLLVIVIIVLSVKFKSLATEKDQVQKQKDELQEKVNNLGWLFFNSNLYYISTVKKNWTESRQDCRNRGLDLAIISCALEQMFVDNLSKTKNGGVYIGLTDRDSKGVWKWVDGTLMKTAYWSPGNGFAADEDCVVNGYNNNNGWYDRPCAETFYWICE